MSWWRHSEVDLLVCFRPACWCIIQVNLSISELPAPHLRTKLPENVLLLHELLFQHHKFSCRLFQ
ncbi:hypothetical protein ATANTOWER_018709, partial [Ataeniobius toweri]|nr:hypothetical protein [Ataeniobius toweri]